MLAQMCMGVVEVNAHAMREHTCKHTCKYNNFGVLVLLSR